MAPGALSALLADLARAPQGGETAGQPGLGTVIGRFELTRRLGAGGFGVVWEARDRQLGRSVAFKLVRPGERAELRERSLLREAEAAARLSHDNIVALHDLGQSEHGPYLVLELLRGENLAKRLERGPLERREALRVLRDVARGVAHAHQEGVVHRDLKPANVFLCQDGRVKVLDFGLAHAFGRRRQSGGTPAYMAPEQWREAPEDERTDVFALGVMLYQLLSGALPFEGEKETSGSRPAPTLELGDAPELSALVARMLEKDPVRRPRDAGEVLAALDAVLAALERAGTGATAAPARIRRHPRWRLAARVAAGAVAGILAATAFVVARRPPARTDGRLLVAVADVVNETGDQELDVLSHLLVTSLEQSRKLAVMTQARVLDLSVQAGFKAATRVNETVGREVGRRNGVSALLLPAVRKLGSTYLVEMRAIDPVRDQHLFTVSDRATTREALLELLDRLSDRTRQQLKEDPAEVAKSHVVVGAAFTKSLEAYQHYLAGLQARDAGRRAVALREQLRALELDPRFAVAHWQVADIYERYGRQELSAPHWEAAARDLDLMPEREQTLLALQLARRGKRPLPREEQQRLAEVALARFPDDRLMLRAAARFFEGQGQGERARALQLQALKLEPDYHQALRHWKAGSAEALAVARQAVVVRRNGWTLWQLAWALDQAGATDEALATARETLVENQGESAVVAWNACAVLRFHGAAAECVLPFRRIVTDGLNQFERDEARAWLVLVLLERGRVREARQVATSGRSLIRWTISQVGRERTDAREAVEEVRSWPQATPQERQAKAPELAWFGDLEGAARVAALVQPGEWDAAVAAWYRALTAIGERRHDEAVPVFRDRVRQADREGRVNYADRRVLVETLLAAGRAAEATEVQAPRTSLFDSDDLDLADNYPWLLLLRARALDQVGRRADAVKELDRLLVFWKDADADLPLLVEAKAMRARLALAPP